MPFLREEITLDTGEEIIGLFRPHSFFVFAWSLPLVLSLIILFLFMFKIFQLGVPGVIFFISLLSAFIFLLLSRVMAWYGTLTILTNRRFISIRRNSLFKKQVSEVVLHNVSELSYNMKGIIQTIFRFGNIHISLPNTTSPFILQNLPNPQRVLDAISGQISKIEKDV